MSKRKVTVADAGKLQYDLHERTALFGEQIISFAKSLPQDRVLTPLISQLVRAGTSVGANYCEADDAVSKKEFFHKIGTCKKEARETKYWLRMVVAAEPLCKDKARKLWQEARELHLIFAAIFRKKTSE
jgi:four helix bundle protein